MQLLRPLTLEASAECGFSGCNRYCGLQPASVGPASKATVCLVPQSCLSLCDLMDCKPARLLCSWDFPGKNTGVCSHLLLQVIFPTHRSNPHLLHWQGDSSPLSHQGSPGKSSPLLLFTDECVCSVKISPPPQGPRMWQHLEAGLICFLSASCLGLGGVPQRSMFSQNQRMWPYLDIHWGKVALSATWLEYETRRRKQRCAGELTPCETESGVRVMQSEPRRGTAGQPQWEARQGQGWCSPSLQREQGPSNASVSDFESAETWDLDLCYTCHSTVGTFSWQLQESTVGPSLSMAVANSHPEGHIH